MYNEAIRAEAATALTDEKLARFAVYQREMMPVFATMMDALSTQGIFALTGRSNALDNLDEEARRKSGMQTGEALGLTVLTSK